MYLNQFRSLQGARAKEDKEKEALVHPDEEQKNAGALAGADGDRQEEGKDGS